MGGAGLSCWLSPGETSPRGHGAAHASWGMLIATLVARGLERLPGLPASMLAPLEMLVSRDRALGTCKCHTLRFHVFYLS